MIAELAFRNWICFRGEQRLVLEPKVYALVARRVDDDQSSNWSGKSALLELPRFVLFGKHRFRTEDEFITRAEGGMEATLTFASGHRAQRSRARGKKTFARFWEPGAKDPCVGDEADLAIERLVGLSAKDYDNTCYFEQKAMSKFVTAKPDERQVVIGAWFRLGPLERCEKNVRKKAEQREARARELGGAIVETDRREAEIRGKLPGGQVAWPDEKLAEAVPLLEAALQRARDATKAHEGDLENAVSRAGLAGRAAEFAKTVEEGKAERARLDAMDLAARQKTWASANAVLQEDTTARSIAARERDQKRVLATGQFDGRCPVASIECPARVAINAGREANRTSLDVAQKAYEAVSEKVALAERQEATARAEMQEAQRLESHLQALRERATKLRTDAESAKGSPPAIDPSEIRKQLDLAVQDTMRARSDLERVERMIAELASIAARRVALKGELDEIGKALGAYREAAAIFGKRGAQRKVAEGALAEIEEDANRELAAMGCGLSVRVQWSRETQGPAKSCDACGWPFPTSTKVKACERCGGARGPNLENKLEIALSDRSGAAEDLGGAHFQLAASRWLREDRGSTWETALIDEPFGSLDAPLRRGLARHLATMLPSYGIRQAIVSSHSPDVNFSMPGRIEVVAGPNGSTARVVA